MSILANSFIAIGVLGIFGSTLGGALFAWAFSKFSKPSAKMSDSGQSVASLTLVPSLDILVPAHNEEKLIATTLASLSHARDLFVMRQRHTHGIQTKIQIIVGLDHCTDKTEETVQKYAQSRRVEGISTHKNLGLPGKWNLLKGLIKKSDAEWVALVDAGSSWEPSLLSQALPYLQNSDVMGIAPSYQPVKASLVERLVWRLECFLKSVESKAGGPTSVHGATVIYRREALLQAMSELHPDAWINDDVVIPLTLRTLWPELRIEYLSLENGKAWVHDHGVRAEANSELGRRKRMLVGNIQWIRSLFSKALHSSMNVGAIASRRVFRTFWAYWVLVIALGLTLRGVIHYQFSLTSIIFGLSILAVLALMPLQGALSRLRAAFWAGLQIPFHLINSTKTTPEKIWN